MTWENLTTYLQLTGAAIAIPAAAGGTYTFYQSYFGADMACQNLRNTIVTTMEKIVPPEAKRALLRKDVTEFDKKCSVVDPDSHVIFQAAVQPEASAPQSARSTQAAAAAPAAHPDSVSQAQRPGTVIFDLSSSGEQRGWVALMRREAGSAPESHFDGYGVTDTALPAAGSLLTARLMLPVWLEPLPPGPNDPSKLQGRVAAGGCVRVLATRPSPGRQWAEVTPTNCP